MSPEFKDALDRTSEIQLTVRGRKSGQDISRPVWFVHEKQHIVFAAYPRFRDKLVQEHAK